MAFNIFKKPKTVTKPRVENKERPPIVESVSSTPTAPAQHSLTGRLALKHVHVSEKASRLTEQNQYTFRVTPKANKGEIKKDIETTFHVQVTNVRVLKMPSKTRHVGRHAGTKPGFKKAIVSLAEGQSISQIKP